MHLNFCHWTALAAILATSAVAQIQLTPLGTIDLDSTAVSTNAEFVGSNPAAIAWDGTDLYIAGFNSSGVAAEVAIVRIAAALTNPSSPTFGPRFGVLGATPNLRGYSGLDSAAEGLAAAYDFGASNPNGITFFDGANGALLWAKAARGGSGVGVDPGFAGGNPALGRGVAWTTFGSGRRALQDILTGADIWTTGTGMIINAGSGTFWRDMDFESATGNIWLRQSNRVITLDRTGDNSVANGRVVVAPTIADFVGGQNLAVIDGGGLAYVIYNDRSATAAGQSFSQVVKVIDFAGNAVSVDLGAFAPAASVGYYDFSWHAPSQTLAVLDFGNRDAHVFQLSEPPVGTNYCGPAVVNSSGASAVITAAGSNVLAQNDLTLDAAGLPAGTFVLFLGSPEQGLWPNPGGSAGTLCLGGSIGRGVGGQIYSAPSGVVNGVIVDLTALPTPILYSIGANVGETWNFQAWFRDNVNGMGTANFTDAVAVTVQ